MTRVSKAFVDMEMNHLECRSWSHAWDHQVTYSTRARGVNGGRKVEALEIHLECMRCAGERIDTFTRSGRMLIRRRYIHPDKYLVADLGSWGGRRVFNENVRVELIGRLATKARRKEDV